MVRRVEVVDYDLAWEAMYEQEKKQWIQIFGNALLTIHHIGSTSVPGLKAKPIIDIMPVVKKIEMVDAFNRDIECLGYECMGQFGIAGRRYFRKGVIRRTHHVHVFDETNQHDIIRHLAVRDYLRSHNEVAFAYGELKSKLAEVYPESVDDYCDGKEEFVQRLEQDAILWYFKQTY